MRRAVSGLLVVLAMAAMTTGAALGASSSSGGMTGPSLITASTPEELCDLLPAGAESRVPWSSEGVPSCAGRYGPDAIAMVDVFELPTDAEALRLLNRLVDQLRESQWQKSAVERGDVGYEFDGTGLDWDVVPDFELGFVRGPYYVIAQTTVLGGGSRERVRRLAEEIDQDIEALLGGGTEPDADDSSATDSGAPDSGASSDGEELDIAGLFLGDGVVSFEAVSQHMDCPSDVVSNPRDATELVAARCEGAVRGMNLSSRIGDYFARKFPEPTPSQEALIKVWRTANFLAVLEARDGQPLFPSILGSIDLIDKLITDGLTYTPPGGEPVPVGQRLLEMLMALDAGTWEQRFGEGQ